MITAIAIPANEAEPARQVQLGLHDLDARQSLVGGLIEAVDLFNPKATVYLNEEGKLIGLPVNQRATAMLWVHNERFRTRDVLCGDVFIVGRPDNRGDDTSVPEELTKLLFGTKRWRVEATDRQGGEFKHDDPLHERWDWAYIYAADLSARSPRIGKIKVVSADG